MIAQIAVALHGHYHDGLCCISAPISDQNANKDTASHQNDDLRLSPALYQLPIALGAAATRYIRSGAAKLVEKMFLSGMLNIDMTMRCAA